MRSVVASARAIRGTKLVARTRSRGQPRRAREAVRHAARSPPRGAQPPNAPDERRSERPRCARHRRRERDRPRLRTALGTKHASVVLADRNVAGAEAAAQAITAAGGDALALDVEIGDSASCKRCSDRTLARYAQIDILVHCAGVSPRKKRRRHDRRRLAPRHRDQPRRTMYVSPRSRATCSRASVGR